MSALEKVSKLNGVMWEWNDEAEKHFHLHGTTGGIIAQDLEKVLPFAVRTHEPSGYKIVDYNAVIGLLVEAVKELQQEVNQLKNGND